MAVFVDVDDHGTLPAEYKVACAGPEDDGQAEPGVVRHEDEHEAVADEHLQHVQERLQEVAVVEHLRPATQTHTVGQLVGWLNGWHSQR